MVERDTIRLLRECDSGVKMGITAIDEVMDHVKGRGLQSILRSSKSENERLQTDLQKVLDDYHDDGKDPNPVVQGMSWVKTNWEMLIDGTDSKIAELMIDGCNMGIKSLSRYMNQYKAADERSKDIAKRLISSEEKLSADMRQYL
ncbi:MAG: hypothetical protein IKP42_04475 [Ruminococcus sp.]|nr:hypothetical protein [Ruminococcus sp.]